MKPLRKRELLLSMKYCTIEGCFSVPMLNLTLGNFPFVIGFAVKGLGWGDAGIGFSTWKRKAPEQTKTLALPSD